MFDSIHLRMAMDVDAGAISRLIVSYSPVAPGTPGWEPFFHSISRTGILERLAQPEYCFVVAVQDGQVAGVIAMRANEQVVFLFVQQECHGLGVGRKLWDKMQAQALERGHPGPFFVNADPRAVAFYERLGFVVSGDAMLSLGIACIPMKHGGEGH
jgi:GNAT superfamily N-acetyltransferase